MPLKDNPPPQIEYRMSPPVLPGERILDLAVWYYLTQENGQYMVKTLPLDKRWPPFPYDDDPPAKTLPLDTKEQPTKPKSIVSSPGGRVSTPPWIQPGIQRSIVISPGGRVVNLHTESGVGYHYGEGDSRDYLCARGNQNHRYYTYHQHER